MVVTTVDVNQVEGRAAFFQTVVERMLTYWSDHEAVKNVDVVVLDRERNRILKNIALGFDLNSLWYLVKKVVIAFAPYMERRGFWDVWQGVLEQAIGIAQRLEDVDAETTLTALLARLCQRMNRTADVVRHYRRVISLARSVGNRFEEARACSNLGYLYIEAEQWWRSEILSKHGLALFEEVDSKHGVAHSHNHLGVLYKYLKEWQQSERQFLLAIELWEAMDDKHGLMRGYGNLGSLYTELQNTESSLHYSYLALNLAEQTGEEGLKASFLLNAGIAYTQSNDTLKAKEYLERALAMHESFADKLGQAQVRYYQGIFHNSIGNRAEALRHFKMAQRLYGATNHTLGEREATAAISELNNGSYAHTT